MAQESRRQLKNFIINPKFQLRLSFYFIVTSFFVIGVMVAIVYGKLNDVRLIMANSESLGFSAQVQISNVLYSITRITLIFLILTTCLSWVYAIVVSHRIAGPALAIRKFISQLKEGDYEGRRPLRPYDELRPIMEDLHELADILKSKK